MEHHMINDSEDTISLSDLQFEDDTILISKEVYKGNQNSTSSSSSSSSSSFDQDFFGFFSDEWSRDLSHRTSPENIVFCGKLVSSKLPSVSKDRIPETSSNMNYPLFRSNSDSFRFTKTVSRQTTPRSKSVPNRVLPSSSSSSSSRRSKWEVFMFGFGSGKFPTTMDMSDIKSRQLRRRSAVTVDDGKVESVSRRNGKKGWWVLVNALGCSGGYERDTMAPAI